MPRTFLIRNKPCQAWEPSGADWRGQEESSMASYAAAASGTDTDTYMTSPIDLSASGRIRTLPVRPSRCNPVRRPSGADSFRSDARSYSRGRLSESISIPKDRPTSEYRHFLKAFGDSSSASSSSSSSSSSTGPLESPPDVLLSNQSLLPQQHAFAPQSEFAYHKMKLYPRKFDKREMGCDRDVPSLSQYLMNTSLNSRADSYVDYDRPSNILHEQDSILRQQLYERHIDSISPITLADAGSFSGTGFDRGLRRYISSLRHLHLQDAEHRGPLPNTDEPLPLDNRFSRTFRRLSDRNYEVLYREIKDYPTSSMYSEMEVVHDYPEDHAHSPLLSPGRKTLEHDIHERDIHPDVPRVFGKMPHDPHRGLIPDVHQQKHVANIPLPYQEPTYPMEELYDNTTNAYIHPDKQRKTYSPQSLKGLFLARNHSASREINCRNMPKIRAMLNRHRIEPYPHENQSQRPTRNAHKSDPPPHLPSRSTSSMTSNLPIQLMTPLSPKRTTRTPITNENKEYPTISNSFDGTIHDRSPQVIGREGESDGRPPVNRDPVPMSQLQCPLRSHAGEIPYEKYHDIRHTNKLHHPTSLKSCTDSQSAFTDTRQSTLPPGMPDERPKPSRERCVGSHNDENLSMTLVRREGPVRPHDSIRQNPDKNSHTEKASVRDCKSSSETKKDVPITDLDHASHQESSAKIVKSEGQQKVDAEENDSISKIPDNAEGKVDTDSPSKLKCSYCFDKFSTQRAYVKHMATAHQVEKPNICGFCGKGFQDKFDLKRHNRTHTGVRPYKCSACPRAFTQRCSLETHVNKVHGLQVSFAFKERRKKLFVCEDCGNAVNDAFAHYIHIWVQHARLEMPKRLMQKLMRRTKKKLHALQNSGKVGDSDLSNTNLITQTLYALRESG